MKKYLVLLTVLVGILSLPTAEAFQFVHSDDVNVDAPIMDDTYVGGGNVSIDADIMGDLYVGGGLITIQGNVLEDLVITGGKVDVWGNVGGDVRVLGGQVAIHGAVGDDVFVAGVMVDIGKDAVIGGSVLSGAGKLTIDGHIKENVRGFASTLILNGTVDNDVVIIIQESILFGDLAKILGNLDYSAILKANVPENVVQGTVNFNKFEKANMIEDLTYVFFVEEILSYVAILVLALLLIIFVPKVLIDGASIGKKNLLKTMGVGILAVIVAFVGSILLLISVIGIPLGLIVLCAAVIIYYLSVIFLGAWIANYFFDFNKKKKWLKAKLFFSIALSLIAYYLVTLIPFAGVAISILLSLVGIGIIILLSGELVMYLKTKKMI